MADMLQLTTRMNALARVTLGNTNIAATTALQVVGARSGWGGRTGRALGRCTPGQRLCADSGLPHPQAIDPIGRELALRRGANILVGAPRAGLRCQWPLAFGVWACNPLC